MAGSTNSIIYLSQGLAARGHLVYIGCRRESLLYRTLESSQVRLIPMTFKNKWDLKAIRKIVDIVKENNIQVINAQSSRDRYLSIFARWFYRLQVLLIHTRRQVPLSAGGKLHSWFYQRGTDKIVLISNGLKKIFLQKGYSEKHLHIIHNGTPSERYQQVDLNEVEKIRMQLGLTRNDIIIGSVARPKNQSQIIATLPLLDAKIRFLMVGVEPGHYDEEAKHFGVANRVIYAGTVNRDQVLNYYKLMHINILASTMDGFGLALVEAMALNVPVIATDYAGIRDVVIDEVNGLLFSDGDIEGLATQIKRLLQNENLRKKLISNGRKTALEDFSIEKTVSNYETFFTELMAE